VVIQVTFCFITTTLLIGSVFAAIVAGIAESPSYTLARRWSATQCLRSEELPSHFPRTAQPVRSTAEKEDFTTESTEKIAGIDQRENVSAASVFSVVKTFPSALSVGFLLCRSPVTELVCRRRSRSIHSRRRGKPR